MKRLLVLVAFVISLSASAQVASKENKDMKLTFFGWTSYSSYAGYTVWVTNYSDNFLSVAITVPGGYEVVGIEPGETVTLILGDTDHYTPHALITARTYGGPMSALTIVTPKVY